MDSGTLDPASVVASLTYLAPMAERPYSYQFTPPPEGRPQRFAQERPVTLPIADARPLAAGLSLDIQGFLLRRHGTGADLFDEAAVERDYYPEMERLVLAETGARRVLVFDHTLRLAGGGTKADGSPVREPVPRVHNDYTPKSAPQRVRDLLPDEAEALLARRYAFVNVWRPLKAPLRHMPLAFCDARTLRPGDAVASDLIYRDRVGEFYLFHHQARHRWFHFPAMATDEVALIKCFDSDAGRARWSAHTAFADPTTPADAPPRASLEIRTIAFF
jgi:hypothetical protein